MLENVAFNNIQQGFGREKDKNRADLCLHAIGVFFKVATFDVPS